MEAGGLSREQVFTGFSMHTLLWDSTSQATYSLGSPCRAWPPFKRSPAEPSELRDAGTKLKPLSLEVLSLMSWSLQMAVSQSVRVGRELHVKMCFWSASPLLQHLAHRPFWHSSGALSKHRGSLLLGVLCKTSKGQCYQPVFFLIPVLL